MANLQFYQDEIVKHVSMHNRPPSQEVTNIRPRDVYQDSDIFRNYEKLCQGIDTHVSFVDLFRKILLFKALLLYF